MNKEQRDLRALYGSHDLAGQILANTSSNEVAPEVVKEVKVDSQPSKKSSKKPKDTDGDGTPDYLDLDSDNDGIPDSEEA